MSNADLVAASHAADTEFFVRRGMTKGYQWASILAPPVYTAFVLSQRGRAHFSINRLLRATWISGAAGALLSSLFYTCSKSFVLNQVLQREVQSSTFALHMQMRRTSESGGL